MGAAPVLTRNLAREVRFGLFPGSRIFCKICLRLFQARLERSRIDREEQLAFSYVGAISEMNPLDAAGDLRLNRDDFARDDPAERIEVVRNILRHRRANDDWCGGTFKTRLRLIHTTGERSAQGTQGQENSQRFHKSYSLRYFGRTHFAIIWREY